MKRLVQEKAKIKCNEQIISTKKEVLADDKFLFHYLSVTPHLEEESKGGNLNVDNFNMAIVEEELTQNVEE